ncbi:MAG TPA: hypothetical protein VJS45_17810 [Acidimicrobiia bacterium]|nr:hypothetical protein [Acidimicrobiia bacterium]
MVLDERSRHQLYLRLEEALGEEAATTLMEHLPPIGWADVATKRDLQALEGSLRSEIRSVEERLELRFVNIDQRFETLEQKLIATFRGELQTALTAQGRQLAITLAGTTAAISALAFAAARLT